MNRIVLHGALAEEFGVEHNWLVSSPRDAFAALCANFPAFESRLRDMELKVIRTRGEIKDGFELDLEQLGIGMTNSTVHIVPMPAGAKEQGLGKILAGIAIIGAVIITGGGAAAFTGAFMASSAFMGVSYGSLFLFGSALALGGVAQMLAPTLPGVDPNSAEDEKASFLFNGAVNVTEQGHPVPLVYGRMRTGSVVVSASLVDEQISLYAGNGPIDTSDGGWIWSGGGYDTPDVVLD